VNILNEFLGDQPTSNLTRALESLHVHKSPPQASNAAVMSSPSLPPLINGKDITRLHGS